LVSLELPPAASSLSTVFSPAFVSLTSGTRSSKRARGREAVAGHARCGPRRSGVLRESWAALAGRPAQWFLFDLFEISVSLLFHRFE
jgi:hypothetical protein